MPRIVIEADTQEELMDTLINLGIAQAQSRQLMQAQQQQAAQQQAAQAQEESTVDVQLEE